MLVSATILMSICLSLSLAANEEAGLTSLQHQYHPYHQYRASKYQNNRRTLQRALNLHHLNHSYRSGAKPSTLQSHLPKIVSPVRREDKKLIPVFAGQQNRNRIPSQQNLHLQTTYHRRPSSHHRAQRKIETQPLNTLKTLKTFKNVKLDTKFLKNKSTDKKKTERKSEEEQEEEDNIAVESNIQETRVRPEPLVAPVKKSYSEPSPGPKFIIKQAGPSQQFGWVGHGRYAPLNIPNIFKTVGLNTAWIPGVNSIFPVGLNYPAPPSQHKHSPGLATVKKTTTTATTAVAPVRTETYKAPVTTTTTSPTVLGDIPVYKPSHNTPLPVYRPGNKKNQIETLYYGSQINLYTPPVKTTTTTTTTASTTTTTTTTYKPVTTTPALKYTYKTYKTTSRPAAPFRYSSPPVTSPSPVYSSPSFISTPAPYYGSHSTPHYGYGSPQPSIAPYHGTPHYGYGSPQPSIAPYHGTPQYGYGSPQPSPAPHRTYHQPSSVRPFTAFTAFSRSTPAPAPANKAPIVGIIETEAEVEQNNSDQPGEGEVFYIFYENEDLPQVCSDEKK